MKTSSQARAAAQSLSLPTRAPLCSPLRLACAAAAGVLAGHAGGAGAALHGRAGRLAGQPAAGPGAADRLPCLPGAAAAGAGGGAAGGGLPGLPAELGRGSLAGGWALAAAAGRAAGGWLSVSQPLSESSCCQPLPRPTRWLAAGSLEQRSAPSPPLIGTCATPAPHPHPRRQHGTRIQDVYCHSCQPEGSTLVCVGPHGGSVGALLGLTARAIRQRSLEPITTMAQVGVLSLSRPTHAAPALGDG